ncbi:MAG: hypothetical protein NC930_07385 [Candidatus Omnitrophica bacterium]|nr:hypothetical protein [Candidatus Omnitrophota bacterium]
MKISSVVFAKFSANFGILICLFALLGRVLGYSSLYNHQPLSLYVVGMSLILLGCWVRLDQK